MAKTLEQLPTLLKAFRKTEKLSVIAFAEKYGLNKDNVYKWEKGTRPTQFEDLKKLESILITNDFVGNDSKSDNRIHLIPYYDVAVSAGVLLDNFQSKIKPDAEICVPGLNDCDIALNVWGDSMYPKYCSGEIVVCKNVNLDKEMSYVRFGEAYVIQCDDGPVLKYLKKGVDEKHLAFESENKHYETYQVEKSRIKSLHLVKGVITRKNL